MSPGAGVVYPCVGDLHVALSAEEINKKEMMNVVKVEGKYGDTGRACRDGVRKMKAHLELNLGRDTKGNKNIFYRQIISKRKTRENVDLLLNRAGALATTIMEKTKVPQELLQLSLLVTPSFRNLCLLRLEQGRLTLGEGGSG